MKTTTLYTVWKNGGNEATFNALYPAFIEAQRMAIEMPEGTEILLTENECDLTGVTLTDRKIALFYGLSKR